MSKIAIVSDTDASLPTELAAAEAAARGAAKEEVIAAAMQIRDRAHLYGALSTLKYLAMRGRFGCL